MFTVDIISHGSIPLIRFDQRLEGISKLNLVDNSSKQILLVRKTESMNIFPLIILCSLGYETGERARWAENPTAACGGNFSRYVFKLLARYLLLQGCLVHQYL